MYKRQEKDKRDVKAVTEYVRALGETQKRAQADSVVREYMARCPVVQLEDKDTYLLINKFVFEDVYSNAFEYGIFMQRKMHWEKMRFTMVQPTPPVYIQTPNLQALV